LRTSAGTRCHPSDLRYMIIVGDGINQIDAAAKK